MLKKLITNQNLNRKQGATVKRFKLNLQLKKNKVQRNLNLNQLHQRKTSLILQLQIKEIKRLKQRAKQMRKKDKK